MQLSQHVEQVRVAREQAHIPRTALARALGRSVTWLKEVEAGCLAPSREDAERIADLLDAEADDLFTRIRSPRCSAGP